LDGDEMTSEAGALFLERRTGRRGWSIRDAWHGICSVRRTTKRRAGGLSGPLKVLLAASDAERAASLEQRIGEISNAVILRVPPGASLLDTAGAAASDVIIVDLVRLDRQRLDDLRRVSTVDPRPIIMFVDHDDRLFMEEAIAAGVSSYNVVSAAFPDVTPIIMAAVAIFRKYQQVAADLQKATTTLMEGDAINRAKAMLMRQRNIDEPQAYRWMRRKAMNENKRIAAVAADLLAGAKEENPQR
jgi:two-component system, response regulator / RNA-binding antiterminator